MAIVFRASYIYGFVAFEKGYPMCRARILVVLIFMLKYSLIDKNNSNIMIVSTSKSDLYLVELNNELIIYI